MLGVMKSIGASLTSGALRTYLIGRVKYYKIDTSHFLGQSWNKGNSHIGGPIKKRAEQILIFRKNSVRTNTKFLKRALLEIGRKYKCASCG